jgi:hypothetical protein
VNRRSVARFGLFGAAALAAAALAGCGPADLNAMNTTFDKAMHDSCVSSATAKTGNASGAEAYCTCVAGKLDSIPVLQRMQLTPASNELTSAAAACQPGADMTPGGGGGGGAPGGATNAGP